MNGAERRATRTVALPARFPGATSANARSRVAVEGRIDRRGCQFGCSGGFRNRFVGALRSAKTRKHLFLAALCITRNMRCTIYRVYCAQIPFSEMNTD